MSWIKLNLRKKQIKFLTYSLIYPFLGHQWDQWELFRSTWILIFVNGESSNGKLSWIMRGLLMVFIDNNQRKLPNWPDIPRVVGRSENCLGLLKNVLDFWNLFETSENCLGLPRICFKLKKLFWTSEKYLTLCKTVWDFQVLFKTSRTVSGFRGVFDTSEKCLRVLRTVWDFWELFQISKESLKAPRTVWDLREMYETFENCPRFSGYTVRKHCGKTNKIVKENSNPSGP